MNHVSHSTTALAAAILLCLSCPVHADESRGSELARVVVTAQRLPQPVNQALAAVTVLERVDIERSLAPDLPTLLARQAGIDLVRTGGQGSLSTINLRGGNSNHTLVIVDGLRVNSAVQGLFDFAHLPLAQIERIEIVRGPRAALWGSDAIGGVIQIFTRDNDAGFVEARVGSYREADVDAGVGTALGAGHLGLAVGHGGLAGFSATNPAAGPYSYNPDRDGYRNNHVVLRLRQPVGTQTFALNARVADATGDYDQGTSAIRDQQFGATLSGALTTRWSHELVLGRSSDRVDSREEFFQYGFASTRSSLDWLHRLDLAAGQRLQLGLNWSRESGSAEDSYLGPNYNVDRRNTGVFASWSGEVGAQSFEASLRRDHNSQFGNTTTANAGWGWQAREDLRLRATWGQGFRAPNFNELYYPGFGGYYAGNPALRPERSQSAELGVEWNLGSGLQAGLSAYRTRVRDLIAFAGAPYSSAVNVARAHLDGVEAEFRWQRGAWSVAGNAGWQRAVDGQTGEALLRRAPRKAHLSLDYRLDRGLSLGVDMDVVAARPDLDFNAYPARRIALAGYGLLGLRASLPVAAGWELSAHLDNLANRDYALAQGFNTPGRSGQLSLRWTGR